MFEINDLTSEKTDMGLNYFDQFITVVFSTQLRISYLKLALTINRLKPGMVSVIGIHKRINMQSKLIYVESVSISCMPDQEANWSTLIP